MEDIVQSLDDVLEKIEDLKRETEVKQANKDRDKAREEAFKDRTTRSIENEQRERKYEDQRLEMEIEELCESRNKLESKIRKHDGDISDLNALIQELSRVNSSLKDQINKNELSRQYENRLLEASIHANCANSRRERMFVLDMVEKIINEHK
ncbi:MAG: hypothetical protein NMK33_06495 (plasmid) [Candidatus Cardinium sp.]|nr:MAG: hypothetical protein NMK33_06495 [Candidatus Cardinium sp.]